MSDKKNHNELVILFIMIYILIRLVNFLMKFYGFKIRYYYMVDARNYNLSIVSIFRPKLFFRGKKIL